jgi:serine/threonine protein kinase
LDEGTGYLVLFSRASNSGKYEVSVDGVKVGRGERHLLNKQKMRLSLGGHVYDFEYMPFASTNEFEAQRRNYMSEFLQISGREFTLTPTPKMQSRTLGEWTIGSSLGRGTFGKVYSATNSKGGLVAIKIVDRNSRTEGEVEREIKVMDELTKLVKSQGIKESSPILCLQEVIYTGGHEDFQGGQFEDVAYVFEQCVPETFEDLLKPAMENHRRSG